MPETHPDRFISWLLVVCGILFTSFLKSRYLKLGLIGKPANVHAIIHAHWHKRLLLFQLLFLYIYSPPYTNNGTTNNRDSAVTSHEAIFKRMIWSD